MTGNDDRTPAMATPHLRIGAVLPQTEMPGTADGLRRFGEGVASLGFSHLLAYDHVLGGDLHHHPKLRGRYTSVTPFHEVMVAFGFLAAVAPGLEMVSGVLVLPQRQTALVAKQAAEVDIVTGGKFRLGVGIGWNDIEYEGLNENFRNRARRMEDQIDVLRRLWTEDTVTIQSTHHHIDHAGLLPTPVQRPIPLWIGASAEAGVRRAARLADGFFPNGSSIEEGERVLAILRDELAANDRVPAGFGLEPRLAFAGGTPETWRTTAGWWLENGARHLTIATMNAGLTDIDAHLDALHKVRRSLEGLG